jgi:hypothetical protein
MTLLSNASERFSDALVACVDFCALNARAVIVAAVLLALASLGAAVFVLKVNTNSTGMIDSSLDFRQRYDAFARLFPQLDKTLIAVVEADDPEIATEAARSLVQSFESRPDLFTDVYAPGVDPFFDRHGLLYVSEAQLEQIALQLQSALPLIAALARDQSLRGLAQLFQGLGAQVQQGATLSGFTPFLDELDRVVRGHASGNRTDLQWDRFLAAGNIDRRGSQRFVFIKPVLDFTSLAPAEAAMNEARRLAADPETVFSGAARIRFTGEVALNAEELRSVTDSAALAGLISLVLVSIVLTFGVRSWRLVAASICTLLIGLLCTAGFATVAIGYLNLISVAFAVLFVGLGIDFAIHFVLRYEEETRRGRPLRIALANTAEGVGGALAICTGAAAVGFLAFTPTSFHGMAQLGIISAVGMVIAFVSSITVLPAFLTLMPLQPTFDDEVAPAAGPVSAIASRARLAATGATVAACVIAAFFVPQIRFDGDPVNLKDPQTESVQTYMELLADGNSSPYILQVMVDDAADVPRVASDLMALDDVRGVVSVLSYLPPDQERKLPVIQTLRLGMSRVSLRDPVDIGNAARGQALFTIQEFLGAMAALPDEAAAASGTRLLEGLRLYGQATNDDPSADAELERSIFRKLPSVIDRISTAVSAEEVTVESLPESIRGRYLSAHGDYRLEVLPAGDVSGEGRLERFVDAVRSVEPQVTGSPAEIVGAADVVVESMFEATLIAGILIIFVLAIALRSAIDVALVVMPIALAATLTLAATVWFDIPFNFANVIVLPLLIGLGVAGGVHLVVRARASRGREAYLRTNTPRAVLLSALTTIGSFASLAISDHRGMASMGELLTISIVFTLLCTLVVLPAVLAWISAVRER